jgi:hypothetical protein
LIRVRPWSFECVGTKLTWTLGWGTFSLLRRKAPASRCAEARSPLPLTNHLNTLESRNIGFISFIKVIGFVHA